ncbi:MAG TPA: RNA-binding domain-containing protein [Steroidobacteraceae bacterium]|nr:RNA-binding domain-containing protein [Steroidobacteraceae bacterium]
MALDAQLQELLREPRERLDVELKGWLNLTDNGHRGVLAKALIAIANHGGGFVLIGFEDDGTTSPNRPADLSLYSQDTINDTIDRYADPVFHCNVHHVARAADGLAYPVISVPGGHKVPIRSRRSSPANEIQQDRYYIRRPGPASEPPNGGHEWTELIRRCVRNDAESIASLVRDVVAGRAPKAEVQEDSPARLERWADDSFRRWVQLIAGLQRDHPSRMPHGHYRVYYLVDGLERPLLIQQLRDALRNVEQRITGWPPWWWAQPDEIAPHVHENTIECHMGRATNFNDAAHADFWRASVSGELFLIRGYIEDTGHGGIQPGTTLDLTIPIWRVAECLLHAHRFALAIGAEQRSIVFGTAWSGLQGRTLASVEGRRPIFPGAHRAHTDSFSSMTSVPASRIPGALPEITRDLIGQLYALFDFFEPPDAMYAEEIDRMLGRRH